MRTIRMTTALVGTVAVVASLTGCANDGNAIFDDGYAIFDRAPTSEDVLPADFDSFEADSLDQFDLTSVRFAASDGDTDLYLLRSTGAGICLAVAAGKRSVIACGGGPWVETSGPRNSYRFGPSPISVPEGWTRLTENIAAGTSG